MLAASSSPVITADHLDTLEPQQMRAALLSLMGELAERDGVIARQGQEAVFKQAQIVIVWYSPRHQGLRQ